MEKISLKAISRSAPKIAIIYFPWKSPAPYKFLTEVMRITEPISEHITIIGGQTSGIEYVPKGAKVEDIHITMHYTSEMQPKVLSALFWMIKCIFHQTRTSYRLVKNKRDIDVVIFYMAYPYHLLPLITAKLLKLATIEVITRSRSKTQIGRLLQPYDSMLFRLLDGIAPESDALVREHELHRWPNKILPNGARSVDPCYTITKNFADRKKIIGFVGRHTKAKGILEFILAIPIVLQKNPQVEFMIVGDGELHEWVKSECARIQEQFNCSINITGWIDHDMQNYLNEMSLLVLPSSEDAFPTIVLEAMACGTPVLSTSIGAIGDILNDCETGFTMGGNSPNCIAMNIDRAMQSKDLEMIISNAHLLVERKYRINSARERWKRIIKFELRE